MSGQAVPAAPSTNGSRRREILRAAVELFHENGYHATAMDDIGAVVGLTGPALYRHFDSKAAILETALLRAARYMEERVAEVVTTAANPRTALETLVRDLINVLVDHPAITAIAESERRNLSDRARAIYDRSARMRATEWIGPLMQLRPELTETEARLVVDVAQGLVQQAVRPSRGVDTDRVRELLFAGAMAVLFDPLLGEPPTQDQSEPVESAST
jgi:AcrR family transcriptional regulator